MTDSEPAPPAARRPRSTILAALVVSAALIGVLGHQSASSPAPSFSEVLRGDHGGTTTEADGAITEADSALPDEEAARWVATADTSAHVSGDAVDIGHSDATAWLSEHGAEYGLCQTYRNEPWHYERRPQATNHRCPPSYADPTHDPRMQQ
jgi:zinc D-Ala-D-Ala carboxypeptidase